MTKYAVTQQQKQAGNIMTNDKVEVHFYLPEISKTERMTWEFHLDESDEIRYDTILGRDIPT